MSDLIIIDKNTYKLMKYVYRHQEVSLASLERKFGDDSSVAVCYLCSMEYGAYRRPDKTLTYDTSVLDSRGFFGLTIPGNQYVESRSLSFTKWIVPTIISVLALIASVAALIASMGNEIIVHLVK